jgi:BirA family biotin operon repressor/biotin-[acetyl-CoA-carboxylase] ligase
MQLDPTASAAGVRLRTHDQLDSTNSEALAVARKGESGPLWITAAKQTAGRGRRGRKWISTQGNLHASLLLTDPGPPENWPQLSFVAALAVHDAVADVAAELKPLLEIKWPNDLLAKGRKFAGILIEGEAGGEEKPGAVAIGIGINCASHPKKTDFPATDLAALDANVSPAAMFAALSRKMLGRLAQWNSGDGFSTIRTDWLARASGRGDDIRVRLADRELTGRFDSIDDAGRMVLQLPGGGTELVTTGDVLAIDPAGRESDA